MRYLVFILTLLTYAFCMDAYSQRLNVGKLKDIATKESKSEVNRNAQSALTEKATVYPAATPANPNYSDGRGVQYGTFYTDDSYKDVKAYYVSEAGNPQIDKMNKEVFVYRDRGVDSDRVTIITSGDKIPLGITKALRELKSISERGLISETDYKQIKEKYEKTTGFWKSEFCIEIYEKHKNRLDPSKAGNAMNDEAQRLIMSGKRDEGVALMQKGVKDMEALIQLCQSPKIADEWIKCLDEIVNASKNKSNYWNLMISIYSTGKG